MSDPSDKKWPRADYPLGWTWSRVCPCTKFEAEYAAFYWVCTGDLPSMRLLTATDGRGRPQGWDISIAEVFMPTRRSRRPRARIIGVERVFNPCKPLNHGIILWGPKIPWFTPDLKMNQLVRTLEDLLEGRCAAGPEDVVSTTMKPTRNEC